MLRCTCFLQRLFSTTATPPSIAVSKPVDSLTSPSSWRPRRAVFNVPGADERKLLKAQTSSADVIVLDLEDGVAYARKGEARQKVFGALSTFPKSGITANAELAVRINSLSSGLAWDDLNVILHAKKLDAIIIPKVQSANDVVFVSRVIDNIAPEHNRANIKLYACIESAGAMMQLRDIAGSDRTRLVALVFSAEDYCADVGMTRTKSRTELLYARSAVLTAARAYGLDAIDMVCLDYKDMKTLEEECVDGRAMGYDGKQVIHPGQIDLVQQLFSPSKESIDRAKAIVDAYTQHSDRGIGAFDFEGKVVDLPVVKWAQRLLAQAQLIAGRSNSNQSNQ